MSTKQKIAPAQSVCMNEESTTQPAALNRRRFLRHTALGLTAALFTAEAFRHSGENTAILDNPEAIPHSLPTPDKPRVKPGVEMCKRGKSYVFEYRCEKEQTLKCRCTVNKSGAEIMQNLDGSHTIEEVAALVSADGATAADATACAKIAQFVAQLGSIGFLIQPYYVHIYETYC